MNAVEYLINKKDEYKLDIINDTEYHDMYYIYFEFPVIIWLNNYSNFRNVFGLTYNTITNHLNIFNEDDYVIGFIENVDDIDKISQMGDLLYKNKNDYRHKEIINIDKISSDLFFEIWNLNKFNIDDITKESRLAVDDIRLTIEDKIIKKFNDVGISCENLFEGVNNDK